MKKSIKLFMGAILCMTSLLPFAVNASTPAGEWSITWGAVEGEFCQNEYSGDTVMLTNKLCNFNAPEDLEKINFGVYSHLTTTFTFEKDASAYIYGHEGDSKDNNTIVINGNNSLDYLYEEYYDYKISGNGSLKIGGVYAYRQATDEDGNTLCLVSYKASDNSSVVLKDEEGNDLYVASKDKLETMFETLKANNPSITDTTYNVDKFQLGLTYYKTFIEPVTKEWVNDNIVTELPITYNEDGSILIGTVVTDNTEDDSNNNENTGDTNNPTTDEKNYSVTNDMASFTSKVELDKTYRLAIKDLTTTVDEGLKNKKDNHTLLSLYDISVLDVNGAVVPMKNGEFTLKIKLTEEMKKYETLVLAYIEDGEIKEEFSTKIEGDYLVAKITHLSEYAVFGVNSDSSTGKVNPSTADPFVTIIAITTVGLIGSGVMINLLRKRYSN